MATNITLDLDLYGILGVEASATVNQIKKAYKKKALKCHPDKNPDNPKAALLFHELKRALELLLNKESRAKYDNLLNARDAARKRHSALDGQRKKFKEDLERREQQASFKTVPPEQKLKNDIDHLQKEGERLQNEFMREEFINKTQFQEPDQDISMRQLKISWSESPGATAKYTEKVLRRIFTKYANVEAIVATKNKAIIEMSDASAAALAVKIEVGFPEYPLKVAFVDSNAKQKEKRARRTVPNFHTETLAERAARQTAERTRLIAEILIANEENKAMKK